jgi:hypothetical protein
VDYWNYSVDLPYTKSKIDFREINTQEQILITKASISIPNNKESLFEYHNFILSVILNCVKDKNIFYKINIIEYILFLIKLRSISIGSTIDFILKEEENKKSKTKIQIDLKKYMMNLFKASNYFEDQTNSFLKEKKVEIKINWPLLSSVKTFNELSLNSKYEYEIFENSLFEFIVYIKIENNKINFNELKTEEKIKLFEKLPIVLKNKIQKNVIDSIKSLIDVDLFEISLFKDYKFSIYNLNFVEHIKMIFSYDLKSLFREIYYLSTNGLSSDYILNISDSERKIYLTIIQEEIKRQEDASKGKNEDVPENEIGYSQAVKDLALEFGENLNK